MAEAVDLAKMHSAGEVDAALEAAADVERFGDGDLAHHCGAEVIAFPHRRTEVGARRGAAGAWHTLEGLEALLRGHRADGSVTKAIAKLIRVAPPPGSTS